MPNPSSTTLRVRFGQNVRAARIAQGIAQEALADMSGLSRTYMSGVERGVRNIGINNIERIARALRVDPATLVRDKSGSDIPR